METTTLENRSTRMDCQSDNFVNGTQSGKNTSRLDNQSISMLARTENQSNTTISGMNNQSVPITTRMECQSDTISGMSNHTLSMTTRTESQSDTMVTMVTGIDNQSVARTTEVENQSAVMVEDDLQIDDEYATQYFGFVPQTFMNGMYNCICEYTHDAAEALSSSLLNTFKDSVSESEVKDMCNKQLQAAVKRLDKIFDMAESYLTSNIFHIPRHVVLTGDRVQLDDPCTAVEMTALDDQLKQTTDQIWAVKFANARLCQRASDVKSLQTECSTVLDNLETMYTQVAAPSKQFYQSAENMKKVSDILKNINKEGKT